MIRHCYIHIPFCNNICSYCDFCKIFYNEEIINQYLNSLEKEIKTIYKKDNIKTIYIGGGTPSSLNINSLKKLFNILSIINKDKDIEYTIECNFDTITKEKLELFKEVGINRLSFGLESINKDNLKLLGRNESKEKAKKIISLARSLGFNNINVDLMYAIPNENIKVLEKDIDFVLSLDVEHISTYSLIIEEHTKLFINKTNCISEDLDYEMYKLICSKLNNYNHYEISNFSKDGYSSLHNLCYWENKEYYGFGVGASSYIGNKRINNTRSIIKYLDDNYVSNFEKLNNSDKMSYEMILGLRTSKGINKENFYKKYNKEISKVFNITKLLDKKLLVDNGKNIYIPKDKWYIENEILVNFIKE